MDSGDLATASVESAPPSPLGDGGPQQRIVQADGRRYSLRLEPEFWTALERAAKDRGIRLGRLVAGVAKESPQGANLASRLRLFCLNNADQRAGMLEESLQEASRSSGDTDIGVLVDSLPVPALVIGAGGEIKHFNSGFGRWFGPGHPQLMGKPFDFFMKLRTQQPFDQIRKAFAERRMPMALGHIMYVSPGRVAAAPCRLVPVQRQGSGAHACLVMLIETRRG
jgi:predicted DNA-binding ribbon-helix-helix protein